MPSRPFFTLCLIVFFIMNVKADTNVFHIECPPDVTVDCDDELWDLSIYGTAIIYGYGGPEPAGDPEWVDYNLNSCNVGTIVRTWVAYDYSGNAYSCSQTIYVGGSGSVHIDWPPDYIIHDCNPWTDPEDLPPPYDFPVIHENSSCSQVIYTYEDLVFDINPPACKKILRKWTVIDWCTYDPNSGYGNQGIWKHTQIIKIVPTNPPVINCPEDITASAGGNCDGAYVSIPPATGSSDCGANVIITNHSPYATHHGADASGFYPLGVTWVTFKAEDGCGGYTSCKMKVTVKDLKKPTPICYYGVSVSLMQMPDGYYMALRPEFFDKGSFDNCTPKHKLKFDIEPKRVDCDDIGEVPVKVYVTDESGNVAYCNTVVYVQDNMGMCPPTTGMLEGAVVSAEGLNLEHVKVTLTQSGNFQMTGEEGTYRFVDVPFGSDYSVTPRMETDNLTGISTLDLLYFLHHVMGTESFTSPYQYLAADLNNSGNVSVTDMTMLRNLILRNIHQVSGQASWKFIDAGFQFTDPFNPFIDNMPEAYEIQNFSGDMHNVNFIGVKLGDISGDAVTENGLQDIQVRGQNPLTLQATASEVNAGDDFSIDIYTANYKGFKGFQLALQFDTEMAEFSGISQGSLPGMDLANFGLTNLQDGIITTSYVSLDPYEKDQVPLFSIRLIAKKDLRTNKLLSLVKEVLQAEAYTSDLKVIPIKLEFISDDVIIGSQPVFQEIAEDLEASAFPNPFSKDCNIEFNLSSASNVDLVFYDISGRTIKRISKQLHAGYHQIPVSIETGGQSNGVIFCDIITDRTASTLKLIMANGVDE